VTGPEVSFVQRREIEVAGCRQEECGGVHGMTSLGCFTQASAQAALLGCEVAMSSLSPGRVVLRLQAQWQLDCLSRHVQTGHNN
jgi:hypothetical protein